MLEFRTVTKRFGDKIAVDAATFTVDKPMMIGIIGRSGAGKSTLLRMVNRLNDASEGKILFEGQDISAARGAARREWQSRCAMIFQQFNLVPYLSTRANVTLPCGLSELRRERTEPTVEDEAERLLAALSIPADHWQRKVTRLSIGQQQRIAAARALIGAPGLILADEPTSALDADNRDRFLELLLTLAHRHNTSVLFVSHDQSLARHFDNQLELQGDRT